METVCVITDVDNGLSNYLCSNNWKSSRKLICLKTQINPRIIDKYFTDDEEIDTIKEAMIETPLIYEFSHNFKPTNIEQFYGVYIEERVVQQLRTEASKAYFVICESIDESFINPNKELDESNYLLNAVATALSKNVKKGRFEIECNVLVGDELVDLIDENETFSFKDMKQYSEQTNILYERLKDLLENYDISKSSDVDLVVFVAIKVNQMSVFSFVVIPFNPKPNSQFKSLRINDMLMSIKHFCKNNSFEGTGSPRHLEKRMKTKELEKIYTNSPIAKMFDDILYNFIHLPAEISLITYLHSQDPNVMVTTALLEEVERLANSVNEPEVSIEKSKQRNFYTFCQNESDQNIEGADTLFKKAKHARVINQEAERPMAETRQRAIGHKPSLSTDKFKTLFKTSSQLQLPEETYEPARKTPLRPSKPREVQSEAYRPVAAPQLVNNDDSLLGLDTLEPEQRPRPHSTYKLFKEKMGRNEDLLELRFRDLQRENAFLKKGFERQNTNFMKLQAETKKKGDKANLLAESLREAQKNFELAKEAKLNAITENKLLEAQYKQLNERLSELEYKYKEKKKKCKKQKKTLKDVSLKHSAELDKLAGENQSLIDKHGELKDMITAQNRHIEEYEKKVDTLKEELADKDKYMVEVAYEMQAKDDKAGLIEKQLADKQTELQSVKETLKATEKSLEELKSRSHHEVEDFKYQASTAKDECSKKISAMEEKLAFYERKVNELNNTNTNQSWTLKEKDKEIADLHIKAAKYEKLKLDFKRLESENVELNKIIEEKNRDLADNGKVFEKFESEFSGLKTELTNLSSENALLKEVNKGKVDELATKEQEKQMMNDELRSKVSQISQLEKNLVAKEKEKEEIINGFERKLTEVVNEITSLQNDNEKLMNNERLANKQIAMLNDTIEGLKAKNKDRKTIIMQLNGRLEKMREELRDKNYAAEQMQQDLEASKMQKNIYDKKVNMVSDIKNMISCYKNLSNSK